jgi:hypothetical protein
LVAKANAQNASHRALVANYDLALQARDQAAISEYMVAVEKLRDKQIETQELLAAVRAEYELLERTRPRHVGPDREAAGGTSWGGGWPGLSRPKQ